VTGRRADAVLMFGCAHMAQFEPLIWLNFRALLAHLYLNIDRLGLLRLFVGSCVSDDTCLLPCSSWVLRRVSAFFGKTLSPRPRQRRACRGVVRMSHRLSNAVPGLRGTSSLLSSFGIKKGPLVRSDFRFFVHNATFSTV